MAKVITVTLNPCLDRTIKLGDFDVGEVNRAEQTMLDAGGKGINVSRALKNFGVENIALGIIGGENGELLKRKLEAEGVSFEFYDVCGETRTNYKIVDKKSGETTDINEKGIHIGEKDICGFTRMYKRHLRDADYVVLAGSIPPGVPDSIYHTLAELAADACVRVILDASGVSLREGLKAQPFAIKPNEGEFAELLEKKMETTAEILDGIDEIMAGGVELVTVSMGGDGAIFAMDGEAYKTGILEVDVKSTVGCGDSVVAGMIYSLVNGYDLKKTAVTAAAAGGVTAGKEGTNMCRLAEVEKAVDRIEIEEIYV